MAIIYRLMAANKKIRRRTWMIPVFIFLTMTACDLESELEIDDIPAPSRLVLNSIITLENDTNRIFFSESKAIFDATNSRNSLEYKSKCWTSWYLDAKVYYLPDIDAVVYKNGQLQTGFYTNSQDSISYYIDNQIQAGDQFRIEASENGRTIGSSVTIPEKPVILKVDTLSYTTKDDTFYAGLDNYGKELRMLVRIKDQPGIKNYYRVFVDTEKEIHYDPEYARYYDIPETSIINISFTDSDDPAITQGNPKNNYNSDFVLMEFQQNYYNIFTDDLFEGGEYTLNIYSPCPLMIPSSYYQDLYDGKYITSMKTKVTVRLQALSPGLYQYFSSLQKSLYYNDLVIEPFRIFCNIEGGLGIFGAINQLKYVVYEETIDYSIQKR